MADEQTKEWGQLREECPDHPGFFFDPDLWCLYGNTWNN